MEDYLKDPHETSKIFAKMIPEEKIVKYLNDNPEFLDKFVVRNVSSRVVEHWINLLARARGGSRPVERGGGDVSSTRVMSEEQPLAERMNSLATVISRMLLCSEFRLYLPLSLGGAGDAHGLVLYKDHSALRKPRCVSIHEGKSVVATAGRTKQPVMIKDLEKQSQITVLPVLYGVRVYSVLAVPITYNNHLYGVIELFKHQGYVAFSERSVKLAMVYASVFAANLETSAKLKKYDRLKETHKKLEEMSSDVENTKKNFSQILKDIVEFCVRTCQAGGGVSYLVDGAEVTRCSCVGVIVGGETWKNNGKSVMNAAVSEVQATGNTQNLWNMENSEGIQSLLTSPVSDGKQVVAIIQLLNKQALQGPDEVARDWARNTTDNRFDDVDEYVLTLFCRHSSLALLLCMQTVEKQKEEAYNQLYKSMMAYYCKEDVGIVRSLQQNWRLQDGQIPRDFYSYSWYYKGCEDILPHLFIHMVEKLFGLSDFHQDTLCRFTATVRKNYRPVTYHNYYHGMVVCHCVFVFLLDNPKAFTRWERLGLLFGAYTHDLDHRGYNNLYMKKYESPIGNLYKDSEMERYHWHMSQILMDMEGCDPFNRFSSEDKTQTLAYMEHAIIATDLNRFFDNRRELNTLADRGEIDCERNPRHKAIYRAVLMNGCDLCASAKPWGVQVDSVDALYMEFYAQGDEEKKRGGKPIAMMDRQERGSIPDQQVGFLQFVCLCCYETLAKVYPKVQPLVNGIESNLKMWVSYMKKAKQQKAADRERERSQLTPSEPVDEKSRKGRRKGERKQTAVDGREKASSASTNGTALQQSSDEQTVEAPKSGMKMKQVRGKVGQPASGRPARGEGRNSVGGEPEAKPGGHSKTDVTGTRIQPKVKMVLPPISK